MNLVYTDEALQDLDNIHAYIALDRPLAADEMLRRLALACRGLTAFPNMRRAAIGGSREFARVRPYVIIYRVLPDVVSMERILHGARRR